MIATGTDIRPLECLLFLRDVRSRTYFEQMKGRGTRVLTPTDLQAVSGADALAKTHFFIVDAVGVCESDKTDSHPLERQHGVSLPNLLLGVALGKRDEDTLSSLAGRLARLERALNHEDTETLRRIAGGKSLGELARDLLNTCDQDFLVAEVQKSKFGEPLPEALLPEPSPAELSALRASVVQKACAPFDNPALRDALVKAKQDSEQTIDTVTIDQVMEQGFDAVAKEKAEALVRSFREFIQKHRAEITALQLLYRRPYRQRLTEEMLKELEGKLRDNHAAWTEDRLWDAFATTAPAAVKGRSQVGRFADLVALVRFALEKQPVLKPFAESVGERFNEWMMDKAKAGVTFAPEQLAWLNLIRDHIATSLSIEPGDFDYSPFSQQGGLGRAAQLFGDRLNPLLAELNEALVA
jgi:type I restriction enzyme R subunit